MSDETTSLRSLQRRLFMNDSAIKLSEKKKNPSKDNSLKLPPLLFGDAGMTLMSTGGAEVADSPLSKSSERVDPNVAKIIIYKFISSDVR